MFNRCSTCNASAFVVHWLLPSIAELASKGYFTAAPLLNLYDASCSASVSNNCLLTAVSSSETALHATRCNMEFAMHAGKQMASCSISNVLTVQDFPDSKKFRIHTKEPFGTTVYFEMLLEAPSLPAKEKWLTAFTTKQDDLSGFNPEFAELVIEGPLIKVKPLGQTSKKRWFRLTNKKLGYYAKDGGAHLGSIPLEFVDTIAIIANSSKDFSIRTTQKFTKSGASEIHCRAASEALRRRWITLLRKTIPTAKFVQISR
eukprot:TRINITY_DN5601_c0_g1_i1.p2 TRINITY_DN5601_c0_g1~~TRINITY_DN5601_c0_g1_i1.p2  ORF type:complete len:259 (+),score=56.80 TRINITY_DN5601_c0_g1_i1:1134-1910(+)